MKADIEKTITTVLCYGDSNTFGYDPETGGRYPADVRWTGVLQRMLGDEYRVIEEGCNGRTTVFDDPFEPWKNGLTYLKPCLNSHKPINIVILMLGSNDLKEVYHASPKEIADGCGTLIQTTREFTKLKQGFEAEVILAAPPKIGEELRESPFYGQFSGDAIAQSLELPKCYKKVAEQYGCEFLAISDYGIIPSSADSLHLTPSGHAKVAEAMREKVVSVINKEEGKTQ